jgi:hypothetical protein
VTTVRLRRRSDSHPNAQACALGAPGFDAAEKRLVRAVLTISAAADVIRASVD